MPCCEFVIYFAIAAFIGVTMLGHILVFRAMFAQADHVSAKRDKNPRARLFRGLRRLNFFC